MNFEEFIGKDLQDNNIQDKIILDTNRICPQKLSLNGKELSMPDPWLRVLEWRLNEKTTWKDSSSSPR